MLSGFLHVRLFDTSVVPKDPESPFPAKKGKLTDPEGTINLICAAHSAHNQPIRLPRPETDEDGGIVYDDGNVEMMDDEGSIVEVDDGGDPPRLIVDSSSVAVVTPPQNNLINQPTSYYLFRSLP